MLLQKLLPMLSLLLLIAVVVDVIDHTGVALATAVAAAVYATAAVIDMVPAAAFIVTAVDPD